MTQNLIIGTPKEQIPTPALIIDLDAMAANVRIMADFFKGEVKLRPHIKTHKCPEIARMQIKFGAIGITCAKLSEAEVMVEHGIGDVLIANQVVGFGKAERLANLAAQADVKVAVDNKANIDELDCAATKVGTKIGVVIEVNVGNDRCGTRSLEETLLLATHISSKKGLVFKGVMGYEGHSVFIADRDERTASCRAANKVLVDSAEMLRSNGFGVEIVSAGGTGTYDMSGICAGITEIEAGSYLFMDGCYSAILGNDLFRPALTVLATVISKPEPNLALIDAGMKSLTHEFGLPQPLMKGATLTGLSEEHGRIALSEAHSRTALPEAHNRTALSPEAHSRIALPEAHSRTALSPEADNLKVGDLVEIWPSHGCTTVNLHDHYCVMSDNKLIAVWKISCRGKSQ